MRPPFTLLLCRILRCGRSVSCTHSLHAACANVPLAPPSRGKQNLAAFSFWKVQLRHPPSPPVTGRGCGHHRRGRRLHRQRAVRACSGLGPAVHAAAGGHGGGLQVHSHWGPAGAALSGPSGAPPAAAWLDQHEQRLSKVCSAQLAVVGLATRSPCHPATAEAAAHSLRHSMPRHTARAPKHSRNECYRISMIAQEQRERVAATAATRAHTKPLLYTSQYPIPPPLYKTVVAAASANCFCCCI